ncbi:MAG: hypothetical protein PWQ08_63 [Clostridiales bacterium]|jgi:hypothetical protein|nr:hypothetical protein [Clostridiales bacterium]
MKTLIKSALDQVHAEETLKAKTAAFIQAQGAPSGNTVAFTPKKIRSMHKKLLAVACALLLVCGLGAGGALYYQHPVAYLSLDINPSIELGVNAFDRVVAVTSYNSDGDAVLADLQLYRQSSADAVATLVQAAAQKGYVYSDGSTVISLTTETDQPALADTLQQSAAQAAQQSLLASGNTAVVYTAGVGLDLREEARTLGISPGKLNLIQKLQQLDPSIATESYQNARVTEIMKQIITLNKEAKTNGKELPGLQGIENAIAQLEQNAEKEANSGTTENKEQNQQKETNEVAGETTNGNGAKTKAGSNSDAASSSSAQNGTGNRDAAPAEPQQNGGKQQNAPANSMEAPKDAPTQNTDDTGEADTAEPANTGATSSAQSGGGQGQPDTAGNGAGGQNKK